MRRPRRRPATGGDPDDPALRATSTEGAVTQVIFTDPEVAEARRTVVGATFVGQDTADLLHAATIAVVGEVPVERLWHAVPAFPTMSEVWLRLLEEYGC